ELALPRLPVAVGVDERVVDLLLGVLVGALLDPPVALRLLEDLAPLLACVDRTLDARHLRPPQLAVDDLRVRLRDRVVLTEPPLLLRRLVLQVVTLIRRPARQLPGARHLELLLRPRVRLLFRHLS